MPPCALTYWKYALAAGAISLYPGAAGPVSGWWLPMRIWVLVIPGTDAAAAPPEPEPPEWRVRVLGEFTGRLALAWWAEAGGGSGQEQPGEAPEPALDAMREQEHD